MSRDLWRFWLRLQPALCPRLANFETLGQGAKLGKRRNRPCSFKPSIVTDLPSERIDYTLHIRKIIDQKVWLIFCKLVTPPSAGCDGDSTRAEGFAAGDIARRVADYIDLGCGEL